MLRRIIGAERLPERLHRPLSGLQNLTLPRCLLILSEMTVPTSGQVVLQRPLRDECQAPITSRISAASSRTRSSSVSHEHMKRAPPLPIKV